MAISIKLLFLIISLFTVNFLWSFALHMVFPCLSKRVGYRYVEKIYFWFLMIPSIFLFSCLVLCERENHWQHIFGVYCTELPHCDLAIDKFNAEYLIYCIIGLLFVGRFIINLTRYFNRGCNYRLISLNGLSEEKSRWLNTVIQRVEEKIGGRLPVLEIIVSHANQAFVKGMFNHRIFISRNLVCELPSGDLENILIHEWEHCRKRDNLKNLAILAAQSLNPWPYLKKKILQTHACLREIACDEASMLISRQPLEIANSIVRVSRLAANSSVQPEERFLPFSASSDLGEQISTRVYNLVHHFDVSRQRCDYFDKISCKHKLATILEWCCVIAVVVVAFNSGCLEDYLSDVHCLAEKVIHMLIG